MNRSLPVVALSAIAALVVGVVLLLGRTSGEGPGAGAAGDGRGGVAAPAGDAAEGRRHQKSAGSSAENAGTPEGVASPGRENPAGGSGDGPGPVRERSRENSLRRMESIGREWTEELAVEASLTAGQEEEILAILREFEVELEGLRWRRGVEEDVETTILKLYERAEARILGLLGAGQKGAFRGIPRDWGFGSHDPGPGR